MNIVLYGDSISEVGRTPDWFGGASSAENNWGRQLGAMLREAFPGREFEILHFGIGGQNAYEGLGRIDGLADYRPDLVLLEFGTNDCSFHDIPPTATGLATYSMIEAIKVRYDAECVVIGPGGDNPHDPMLRHLEETIAELRGAAELLGVPYVDTRRAILEATGTGHNWPLFHHGSRDCHPNDQGHAVWAAAAFEVVRGVVGQNKL